MRAAARSRASAASAALSNVDGSPFDVAADEAQRLQPRCECRRTHELLHGAGAERIRPDDQDAQPRQLGRGRDGAGARLAELLAYEAQLAQLRRPGRGQQGGDAGGTDAAARAPWSSWQVSASYVSASERRRGSRAPARARAVSTVWWQLSARLSAPPSRPDRARRRMQDAGQVPSSSDTIFSTPVRSRRTSWSPLAWTATRNARADDRPSARVGRRRSARDRARRWRVPCAPARSRRPVRRTGVDLVAGCSRLRRGRRRSPRMPPGSSITRSFNHTTSTSRATGEASERVEPAAGHVRVRQPQLARSRQARAPEHSRRGAAIQATTVDAKPPTPSICVTVTSSSCPASCAAARTEVASSSASNSARSAEIRPHRSSDRKTMCGADRIAT